MKKVTLSIDTTGDYTKTEIKERGLKYIPMAYIANGKPSYEVFDSPEEFYAFFKKIDDGMMPTTTQLNVFEMRDYFEKLLKETDDDIVHFTLSSGLSGTYQCAADAAEQINKNLQEKNQAQKIYVVDTKGATQTICCLVDYAIGLRDEGKTAEEIVKASEEFRDRQQIFIVVDDLSHLKRGGRVSGPSAVIGTILNVKPIIIINSEGKLIVHAKAIGLKKAFAFLLDSIKKLEQQITKQTVTVAHTGTGMLQHAKDLAQKVQDEFKCQTVIKHIGTVIGTHLGPNALALVFNGKKRLSK